MVLLGGCVSPPPDTSSSAPAADASDAGNAPALDDQRYPIFTTESDAALEPMLAALGIAFPDVEWAPIHPSQFDTTAGFPGYDFALLMVNDESAGEYNAASFDGEAELAEGNKWLGNKPYLAAGNGLWSGTMVTQTVVFNYLPDDVFAYSDLIRAIREAAARLGYPHPLTGN